MFDITSFKKELSTSWLGRELLFFESLGSTNNYAKDLDRKSSRHGTLVITDEQFEGRGQYERKWISENGLNLTFSLIFEPQKSDRLILLTLAAALAISEIVEEISKQKVCIKWPNDVLVNNKKIAGLLAETLFVGSTLERVVLGIGWNINQMNFPSSIHGNATSLKKIITKDFSREQMLARLLSRIEYYYRLWDTKDTDLVKHINKKFIGYGEWVNLSVNNDLRQSEYKFMGINAAGDMIVLNKELEVNTFSYEQVRVHIDPEKPQRKL